MLPYLINVAMWEDACPPTGVTQYAGICQRDIPLSGDQPLSKEGVRGDTVRTAELTTWQQQTMSRQVLICRQEAARGYM